MLGYDFHLTDAAPQLIEINTNPGGALLNGILARAQRTCCADVAALAMTQPEDIEDALIGVFHAEWQLQRRAELLRSIAIADAAPERQYLYPEFLLFRQLLERHGIDAVICDPSELAAREGRLMHRERPIDFVYNRLTRLSAATARSRSARGGLLGGRSGREPAPSRTCLVRRQTQPRFAV